MNPRLVGCLYVSILAGALAGGLSLAAGWGWLVALALYSTSGSATLLAVTLAVRPGERRQRRPLPAEPLALPARAAYST